MEAVNLSLLVFCYFSINNRIGDNRFLMEILSWDMFLSLMIGIGLAKMETAFIYTVVIVAVKDLLFLICVFNLKTITQECVWNACIYALSVIINILLLFELFNSMYSEKLYIILFFSIPFIQILIARKKDTLGISKYARLHTS